MFNMPIMSKNMKHSLNLISWDGKTAITNKSEQPLVYAILYSNKYPGIYRKFNKDFKHKM